MREALAERTAETWDQSTTGPHGVLTLLALRGVGPLAVLRLASRFATLGAVRQAPPEDLRNFVSSGALPSLSSEDSWSEASASAAAALRQAERLGVAVLTLSDPRYPELLRVLPDRPLVLYVKGTLRGDRRSVACIGTRSPSRFGIEVTHRVVELLVQRNWSVVSGLALGVDTLSHEAALASGGHTVAVLANGLDSVYPRQNAALAERILGAGGALVSEQPFGAPAIPRNLVQRDRLQSGMSLATIPMQTDILGGSMHTVRFTLLQRRLLFAPVPSGAHASEPKSQGLLALTGCSAADLVGDLKAQGDYAELLKGELGNRPPAIGLHGRHDYESLLQRLEDALGREPYSTPARPKPIQSRLF